MVGGEHPNATAYRQTRWGIAYPADPVGDLAAVREPWV
jgi:hypothetical protein